MSDIEIIIEADCNECGNSLTANKVINNFSNGEVRSTLIVKPCQTCMENAKEEAIEEERQNKAEREMVG